MSLDPQDNDGGTWGLAMTAHGPLKMMHVAEDGLGAYLAEGMAPLGSKARIVDFIASELDQVRRQTPGGVLPRVYVFPVTGSPTPLVIPAALSRETALSLQTAALIGLDAVETVASTLGDTAAIEDAADYEAMYRGNNPDASDRQVREEMVRWRQSTGTPEPAPRNSREILRNVCEEAGRPASDEDLDQALAALDSDGTHQDTTALTAVQNYAALASVLGSVAQVAYDTATAADPATPEGSRALQTSKRVFDVIGPICTTIAGVSAIVSATGVGAIVAAVFEVLALVCRFISYLLDYFAGYTETALSGWDEEWDIAAGKFIVRERLRILALVDEGVVDASPSGWQSHWDKLVADGTISSREQANLIKEWVRQTAISRGPARVANAVSIAQAIGGRDATASVNMITDIKNWMLYVGMKPERVDMIYTWLYEARKVTVVTKRREFLRVLRGSEPHEGPGYGVEYRGNMATFVGGSNCADDYNGRCRELGSVTTGCQVNFEYGSARWYKLCRGLDVLNSAVFVPFEQDALEAIYSEISMELEVTPLAAGGAALEGGHYIPLDRTMATPIALAILRTLSAGALPDNLKCGIVAVGPVPVVWMANPKKPGSTSRYVANTADMRSDARSYFTSLKPDGSLVAFANLPNMKVAGPGVYHIAAARPYPSNQLSSAIRSENFRTLARAAALGATQAAHRRTIFSAGTGSSGSGGLLLAGAAVAAGAAAFLLLKK